MPFQRGNKIGSGWKVPTLLSGGAAAQTTLILDQFTDTNGTALGSHTIAPTNTPATSWTARVGTWTTESNIATPSNTASAHATCAPVVSDCTITATCIANEADVTNRDKGIVARWSDTSNYWVIGINSTAGLLRIVEKNAGVETVRASSAVTIIPGTPYVVKAVMVGATLTATLDGANECSYGSATLNQTATIHGVHGRLTVAGTGIDDFKVTSP